MTARQVVAVLPTRRAVRTLDSFGLPGEESWEYDCAGIATGTLVVFFKDGIVTAAETGISPVPPQLNVTWNPGEGDTAGGLAIDRAETKMVGRSDTGWRYSYKLSLSNASDNHWYMTFELHWQGADGFTLHTHTVERVLVFPGVPSVQSGTGVLPFDVASQVTNVTITWTASRV